MPDGRRWIRIVVVNLTAAVMVTVLLTILRPDSVAVNFLVSLVYANTIGTLCAIALPRVARSCATSREPVRWTAVTATLLGIAAVGSTIASAVVVVAGAYPREAFWPMLSSGLRISVVVTLGFGVGMILYETTRRRVDELREQLRANEVARERAERLAAEARLGSLAARLHPHFLFNALNAIAALIPENPERAERLVERLAGLLREALDTTERPTVPLADELRLVAAYLEIEQARLGPRLRVSFDVDDELRAIEVPPLSLQTLVENSVKHVAARRPEGAEIHVSARVDGDRVAVSVTDDGPGFAGDTLAGGHGLDSLRQRLAVLFGNDARLDVTREASRTRVTMSLAAPVGLARAR